MIKCIVCLANSRKLSGRCIAGVEVSEGRRLGWIRPVSAREHQEVSEHERQYEDGSDPRLLDMIDVPLLKPQPHEYQQENWLLDRGRYWKKSGRARWGQLRALADPTGSLWVDGFKTYHGKNDKIPLEEVGSVRSSLRLLRVDRLSLNVFMPGEAFEDYKRRVQGRFVHDGREYRLWVTDPVYERGYLARPDGEYEIGESFLTVSLGEPHEGACYKLIAAVIERDKVDQG